MTAPRVSFLDIAQTLAAYLALPVVLLYPFGFVALFAQFTNYFGLDFYTAWYAASLVNRVVVLGQGATILAVALVGSVLFSGMVAQMLLWHDDGGASRRFLHGRGLVDEPNHNRLLSHADGSWHFLHRQRIGDERQYRVVSLADGEAKFVRVRPPRETASRVAPFPWSKDAVTQAKESCTQ